MLFKNVRCKDSPFKLSFDILIYCFSNSKVQYLLNQTKWFFVTKFLCLCNLICITNEMNKTIFNRLKKNFCHILLTFISLSCRNLIDLDVFSKSDPCKLVIFIWFLAAYFSVVQIVKLYLSGTLLPYGKLWTLLWC